METTSGTTVTTANFCGTELMLTLNWRKATKFSLDVRLDENHVIVTAGLCGREPRYPVNTEILHILADEYEVQAGEEPHDLLITCWEKMLNTVWSRGILSDED